MKKEQIQAWAREAGATPSEYGIRARPGFAFYNMDILQRFADLARADLEAALVLATSDALRNAKIAVNFKAERDALKAEVERLTQQCKLYDAAAYKAQIEARTLVEAAEADALRYRGFRKALMEDDDAFIDRAADLIPDEDVPITAGMVDAAFDAAIDSATKRGEA